MIDIFLWFHKDKIDGSDKTEGCRRMVPMELFVLEDKVGDDGEYYQRDALLNDLELDKVERPAIIDKADAVGRNLAAVLEEGNHP